MEVNLYVGNLSYDTTEDNLKTLFDKAGQVVSVSLIKDRETGKSKGFAFIEMSTQAEAENAINMLNGVDLDHRAIKVNLAKPRNERRSKPGRQSGRGRR